MEEMNKRVKMSRESKGKRTENEMRAEEQEEIRLKPKLIREGNEGRQELVRKWRRERESRKNQLRK